MALAITGVGGNSGIVQRVGAGVALDPDAAAWIAQVEAADGQMLEPALVTAYNEFFIGCKADASPFPGVSNFDAIKASCIMAGARTLAGALVPLRGPAPTSFSFVAGDYSRTLGLVGNGSTKYLNSNWLTFDAAPDNFSMCVNVSAPAEGVQMYIGGQNLSPDDIYRNGEQVTFRSRGVVFASGPGSRTGFLGHSRRTDSITARMGGVSNLFAYSAPNVDLSTPIGIFCRLANGFPGFPTIGRMSYYSIGEAVDLAALDARVTTLQAAIVAALA
jgi:hypothetical protein